MISSKSSADSDAWALLALRSAPSSPQRHGPTAAMWQGGAGDGRGVPIARFEGKDFEFIMHRGQKKVTIGRSSSKGDVDIDMGHSSFVSRCHFQVFCQPGSAGAEVSSSELRFFLTCNGKNGIFVDGTFQRKGAPPIELPRKCTLRFPSTSIKILFQALDFDSGESQGSVQSNDSASNSNDLFATPLTNQGALGGSKLNPLHISIPQRKERMTFTSPCPSPTGTISAANSCPTSPRSSSIIPPSFPMPLDLPSAAFAAAHARSQQLAPPAAVEEVGSVEMGGVMQSMGGVMDGSMVGEEEEIDGMDVGMPLGEGSGGPGCKGKPPYLYAQLIVQAIMSHPERQMTLSGIYAYISKHYPFYRPNDKGWQPIGKQTHAKRPGGKYYVEGGIWIICGKDENSIRHNLSLNRFFVKVARSQEEPGKGSFWRIEATSEAKLMEQAFRRRRQRVANSFRSAPVSPSSMAAEGGTTIQHEMGQPDGSYVGGYPSAAETAAAVGSILRSTPAGHVLQVGQPQQQNLALSQRLVQLSSDMRFIQSAPGSPQGGLGQVLVSNAGDNLIYQSPVSQLLSRQGLAVQSKPQVQMPLLGAAGIRLTSAATSPGAALIAGGKEAEKPTIVLLKSVLGNAGAGDQPHQIVVSNPSVLGANITSLATLMQQQQQQQQQQQTQQQQNQLLIQRLLQQGAMVVSRVPTTPTVTPTQADAKPAGVFTLPVQGSAGLQFVLGSPGLGKTVQLSPAALSTAATPAAAQLSSVPAAQLSAQLQMQLAASQQSLAAATSNQLSSASATSAQLQAQLQARLTSQLGVRPAAAPQLMVMSGETGVKKPVDQLTSAQLMMLLEQQKQQMQQQKLQQLQQQLLQQQLLAISASSTDASAAASIVAAAEGRTVPSLFKFGDSLIDKIVGSKEATGAGATESYVSSIMEHLQTNNGSSQQEQSEGNGAPLENGNGVSDESHDLQADYQHYQTEPVTQEGSVPNTAHKMAGITVIQPLGEVKIEGTDVEGLKREGGEIFEEESESKRMRYDEDVAS